MSLYTRFPNRELRPYTSHPKGIKEQQLAAERLFRQTSSRPLSRDEKTTEVARQIVLDESERRQTLSKALRAARLERAERLTESAGNKRVLKPDR